MNTLIALGTGTAYIYSLAATALPRFFAPPHHVYYETADVIITLLLLGRMLASAAMALSSVSVVTNALRLRGFKPPTSPDGENLWS